MFGLMDGLDEGSWEEKDVSKKSAGYKEYHVNHNHKHVDDTTLGFLVAEEDGDPISVELFNCKKNKDPLKGVGTTELKLDADGKIIIGIDLNGDVVERKS